MLLVKTLAMVLLGSVSQHAAVIYLGSDILLYLLHKIVRKDFYYWLPLEGFLEILSSLLFRIMVKVLTDFTNVGEFCSIYSAV